LGWSVQQRRLSRIFPPEQTTIEKAHGRIETRSVQSAVVDSSQVHFPFVQQVVRVDRRRELKDRCTWDSALYLTSLSSQQAGAQPLGRIIRGHWGIAPRSSGNGLPAQLGRGVGRPKPPASNSPVPAQHASQLLNANARRISRALNAVLRPWQKN
jgi:hypothetical protein